MPILALVFLLLFAPLAYAANPVVILWDAPTTSTLPVTGFQVQRCLVPVGQSTCVPTADLPLGATSSTTTMVTDATGTVGSTYCYTVFSLGMDVNGTPKRAGPGKTSGGFEYVCKLLNYVLPPPGPTAIEVVGTGLRVTWKTPLFAGTDATPAMLTRYDIWRTVSPGSAWINMASVPATELSWTDPTPLKPGDCYEVRAVYPPIASIGNGIVCALAPVVPTLASPANLRLAP